MKNRTSSLSSSLLRSLPIAAAVLALAACNKSGTSSTPATTAAPVAASAASGPGTEVVAKVNGQAIPGGQLDLAMRRRHAVRTGEADGPSRAALEELIDQELEMQQAEKLKLDQAPEVESTLASIRRQFLAQAYLKNMVEKLPKADDAAVKTWYDGHSALYAEHKTYNLQRYEVTAQSEKHDAILAKAQAIKSEAELEAWFKGQNIKFTKTPLKLESEQLQSPVGEKIKSLKPGQAVGQPSGPGLSVFLLSNVQPTPKSLDDAKGQIEQSLAQEARRAAVMGAGKELRKDAKIEYQGKYAEPAASGPAPGASGSMMSLAPAAAPAASR